MTNEQLNKVLDKVRKLKALADPDRNTSEHEIAAALAMARKLMIDYGIEESQLDLNTETVNDLTGSEIFDTGKSNNQAWILALARVISRFFECRYYIKSPERCSYFRGGPGKAKGTIRLVFYGLRSNVEIANYAMQSVTNQILALSKAYKTGADDISYGRRAKGEYKDGLVEGLANHLRSVKAAEKDGNQAQQITALAIRSDSAAVDYLKKAGIKLGNSSYRDNTRGTGDGIHRSAGIQDSRRLNVTKYGLK